MGIVNVTPDSFSDGGRYLDPAAAVAHGLALASAGAAVLDVGGESTRPGAEPVDRDEELRRVVPVVEALVRATDVPVSVDTTKAVVAAAAIDVGARIVNDVSAGRADPDMFGVVAARRVAMILMHMAGEPRTMQDQPHYDDVVGTVGDFLVERRAAAERAGIDADALVVDPGIGFGKTGRHNLVLLANLRTLVERVGVPVLVGASRKRFLGEVVGGSDEPTERDDATLATVVCAVDAGARIVRVHDVGPAVRAVALLEQLALARAA
jgi:dihydropteroate synthase